MAKAMYGGGLRLMECLRLRVMGLDFAKSQMYVRGKGGKSRLKTLPRSIFSDLEAHLSHVKKLHEMEKGILAVSSPLEILYSPNIPKYKHHCQINHQYLIPETADRNQMRTPEEIGLLVEVQGEPINGCVTQCRRLDSEAPGPANVVTCSRQNRFTVHAEMKWQMR